MVFQKTLIRFWTANCVNYENVMIGAIKRNTSDFEQRLENKVFILFIYLKLLKIH